MRAWEQFAKFKQDFKTKAAPKAPTRDADSRPAQPPSTAGTNAERQVATAGDAAQVVQAATPPPTLDANATSTTALATAREHRDGDAADVETKAAAATPASARPCAPVTNEEPAPVNPLVLARSTVPASVPGRTITPAAVSNREVSKAPARELNKNEEPQRPTRRQSAVEAHFSVADPLMSAIGSGNLATLRTTATSTAMKLLKGKRSRLLRAVAAGTAPAVDDSSPAGDGLPRRGTLRAETASRPQARGDLGSKKVCSAAVTDRQKLAHATASKRQRGRDDGIHPYSNDHHEPRLLPVLTTMSADSPLRSTEPTKDHPRRAREAVRAANHHAAAIQPSMLRNTPEDLSSGPQQKVGSWQRHQRLKTRCDDARGDSDEMDGSIHTPASHAAMFNNSHQLQQPSPYLSAMLGDAGNDASFLHQLSRPAHTARHKHMAAEHMHPQLADSSDDVADLDYLAPSREVQRMEQSCRPPSSPFNAGDSPSKLWPQSPTLPAAIGLHKTNNTRSNVHGLGSPSLDSAAIMSQLPINDARLASCTWTPQWLSSPDDKQRTQRSSWQQHIPAAFSDCDSPGRKGTLPLPGSIQALLQENVEAAAWQLGELDQCRGLADDSYLSDTDLGRGEHIADEDSEPEGSAGQAFMSGMGLDDVLTSSQQELIPSPATEGDAWEGCMLVGMGDSRVEDGPRHPVSCFDGGLDALELAETWHIVGHNALTPSGADLADDKSGHGVQLPGWESVRGGVWDAQGTARGDDLRDMDQGHLGTGDNAARSWQAHTTAGWGGGQHIDFAEAILAAGFQSQAAAGSCLMHQSNHDACHEEGLRDDEWLD